VYCIKSQEPVCFIHSAQASVKRKGVLNLLGLVPGLFGQDGMGRNGFFGSKLDFSVLFNDVLDERIRKPNFN